MSGLVSSLRTADPGAEQRRDRFERARRSVINVRLLDQTGEQLTAIAARVGADIDVAIADMEALERGVEAAIADHDWPRVQALRIRGVDQARAFDELQDMIHSVNEARLERQLQEALAQRLGSERRRIVYDAVVMLLILVVVTALLVQEFAELAPVTQDLLDWIDIGACCLFLADFFWRMRLSGNKVWFWRRYWLDFVTSIPLPSMTVLRLGRTVRLIRLLRLFRVARMIRIVLFFWRGMDKLAAAFDVKLMRRSLGLLAVVLTLGSFGILFSEVDTEAEAVSSIGQSLWWSFTTVVTGGFADIHNPESFSGRLLTVALIIAGMVVVGIFTATLTSLLVRENDESEAILSLEERVLSELADLRVQLDARLPPPPDRPA